MRSLYLLAGVFAFLALAPAAAAQVLPCEELPPEVPCSSLPDPTVPPTLPPGVPPEVPTLPPDPPPLPPGIPPEVPSVPPVTAPPVPTVPPVPSVPVDPAPLVEEATDGDAEMTRRMFPGQPCPYPPRPHLPLRDEVLQALRATEPALAAAAATVLGAASLDVHAECSAVRMTARDALFGLHVLP